MLQRGNGAKITTPGVARRSAQARTCRAGSDIQSGFTVGAAK